MSQTRFKSLAFENQVKAKLFETIFKEANKFPLSLWERCHVLT